jgi:hypothetical protein
MTNDGVSFSISREWVLAGKAIFTANNPDGQAYTFRVKRVDDEKNVRPPVWFASLLTGPENEDDGSYSYLGMVHPETGGLKLTRASKMPADALPVRVLKWALRTIWCGGVDKLPAGYGINGAGRCGRCGRLLTRPEGIAPDGYRFGYGPECWEKMHKGARA